MNKVEILVISEFFSPINEIASIRLTKISKFLILNYNITITVVSRSYENVPIDENSIQDLTTIDKIIRIKQKPLPQEISNFRHYLSKKRKSKYQDAIDFTVTNLESSKFLQPRPSVFDYFRSFINKLEGLGYVSQVKREIKKIPNADIIITSFGPKSSSLIGRWYKNKNPSVFWIADHRDPVFSPFTLPLFKKHEKSFVRRICKKADIITGVSQGCLDSLFFNSHPNKVVVTNGFDRDDIKDFNYRTPDKFTLSYLGSLYSGRRDITPLFKIIAELLEEKHIDINNIQIKYAGPSKQDFLLQAKFFDLEGVVTASNSVSRSISLKKQLESHLLILATWNNIGEEGVVTGKFLEYMSINRPIVALVSGNLQNSIVKEMIDKGSLGVCYEEAAKVTDEQLLKEYVLKQYNLYEQNEPLEFNPNKEYVEQFNYINITKQIVGLFPDYLRVKVEKNELAT